jgi:hypothetical protein
LAVAVLVAMLLHLIRTRAQLEQVRACLICLALVAVPEAGLCSTLQIKEFRILEHLARLVAGQVD